MTIEKSLTSILNAIRAPRVIKGDERAALQRVLTGHGLPTTQSPDASYLSESSQRMQGVWMLAVDWACGAVAREMGAGSGTATSAGGTPRVDVLMAKWDDDGATRGSAFVELRDLARELEARAAEQEGQLKQCVDTAAKWAAAAGAAGINSERYERLRILGVAPFGTPQLQAGNVIRFQSLDSFVDADLAAYATRGEAEKGGAA